jgi:hypothetical protein
METEPAQSKTAHSFTITLPQFLVRLYQRLPKSTWRAAFLLFAFGVGIGCGAAALNETLSWYRNRPLPPLPDRKWPDFTFPKYGLKATLSTEWDEPSNKLSYKLALMPSDTTSAEEFFDRLSLAQHGLGMAHVTLNVYDRRHFVVQSSDEYLRLFATVIDKSGKAHLVLSQGEIYLSRDQYAALSDWDLTVSGLDPVGGAAKRGTPPNATGSVSGLHESAHKQGAPEDDSTANRLHGDDVITGYSVVESNLATSGGLTFHVYKDAEADKAIKWGVESARVHYECSPTMACTLHRNGSDVVLHAQLRK